MQKLSKIFGIIFLAVLVLVVSLKVYAQEYSPAVFVVDQDVVDGQVVIARAVINGPGWIVIHADANGAPGPVIGHVALTSGINADVAVPVDAARVTDVLYAMLHVDEGTVGTYEFPGADAPLMLNAAPVTPAFKVTGTSMTLVNTLMISDGFKTLQAAIKSANLEKELRGAGPFTLFAPTDAAFAELPKAQLDALLADPAALREVLLYHVLPGKVVADDVKDGMETATVQGATVKFSLSGGTIMINDATVKAKNIGAHNGVIHVIDKVLTLPESAQVTGQAVDAAAAMTETAELTTTAAVSETAVMTPTATTTPTEAATPTTTPTKAATPTEAATSTATTTPTEAETSTATKTPTEAATSTATTEPTKPATSTATTVPTEAATSTATTTPTEAATATATTTPTKPATATATTVPTEAATSTTTPTEAATEMVTATMAMTETEMVTPTEAMTSTEIMTETTAMTETQAAGADQTGSTPEPTATLEPTATPESTATAMAQEAPSVIVTPEEMPATGGSFSSGSATLPVVLCVMLALAAVAFVTRQRPA